jgi:hypothetical protein
MPRMFGRMTSMVIAALVLLLAPLAASPQIEDTPARFTAAAVDMNRGAAGTLEFVVNRWSSDADRDRLMQVMFDKGPEKLLDALQDMPRMGYIRRPGSIGWDIRFARHMAAPDGGERIILVTDRRMGFREIAHRHRTFDYPFTVIEMQLQKNGEGEGKVSVATRIIADKANKVVTLENYDIQPVLLTKVTRGSVSH